MPKQILKIDQFHGGLNTFSDPRDVEDNQLSVLQNASVSSIGRIVVAGGRELIQTTGFDVNSTETASGYQLFAFSSDYNVDSENVEVNFLIRYARGENAWHILEYTTSEYLDFATNKYPVAWVDAGTLSGTTNDINDIFLGNTNIWDYKDSDFGGFFDVYTIKNYPVFFYIDGALRISDNSGFNDGTGVGQGGVARAKPTVWFGFIQRNYFNGKGVFEAVSGDRTLSGNPYSGEGHFFLDQKGWFSYKSSIKGPSNGRLFGGKDPELTDKNFAQIADYYSPGVETEVVIDGETYNGMNMRSALSVHVRHSQDKFEKLANWGLVIAGFESASGGYFRLLDDIIDGELVWWNTDEDNLAFNGDFAVYQILERDDTHGDCVFYTSNYDPHIYTVPRVQSAEPTIFTGQEVYETKCDVRNSSEQFAPRSANFKWSVTTTRDVRTQQEDGMYRYQTFGSGQSIYCKMMVPNKTSQTLWKADTGEEYGIKEYLPCKLRAYKTIAGEGAKSSQAEANWVPVYVEHGGRYPRDIWRDGTPEGGLDSIEYIEWDIDGNDGTFTPGVWTAKAFAFDEGSKIGAFLENDSFNLRRIEIIFHIRTRLFDYIQAIEDGGHGSEDGESWYTLPASPLRWGQFFVGEAYAQWEDSLNNGLKSWGYSYVYDGKQESGIMKYPKKVSLDSTGFPVAITAYHLGSVGHNKPPHQRLQKSRSNYRITGANIYFYNEDEVAYRVAECDFEKGLKSSTTSDFPDDVGWKTIGKEIDHNQLGDFPAPRGRESNSIFLTKMPLFFTYDSFHGYSESEGAENAYKASFGHAVLNDRRLYVANMFMDKIDGKGPSWHRDLMVGTSPGEYDIFPTESNEVVVASEDGDSIMALASYADRILQFKKNVMYLINITKSSEYLEDTFRGKGVSHPGAVCKTDFGIAWVNKNGCFFYDGKQVQNLTDMKISDSDWSGHVNDNSLVGYHPNSRKIIVSGASSGNNQHAYVFDLVVKSWVYLKKVFLNEVSTNFIIDANQELIWGNAGNTSGDLSKWTESPLGSENFMVVTKDVDFGDPGRRKKIHRVYVTYTTGRSDALPNVTVKYDVNGDTSFGYDFENSTYFNTGKLLSADGWQIAELKPDTSSESNNVKSFALKFYRDASLHTGTARAGVGLSLKQIELATGASSDDNEYQYYYIKLLSGPGAGVVNRIISYVGSTRVATCEDQWYIGAVNIIPTTDTTYDIGVVPPGFEINDISIVYRNKNIK